jgi:hypothetical protein
MKAEILLMLLLLAGCAPTSQLYCQNTERIIENNITTERIVEREIERCTMPVIINNTEIVYVYMNETQKINRTYNYTVIGSINRSAIKDWNYTYIPHNLSNYSANYTINQTNSS